MKIYNNKILFGISEKFHGIEVIDNDDKDKMTYRAVLSLFRHEGGFKIEMSTRTLKETGFNRQGTYFSNWHYKDL